MTSFFSKVTLRICKMGQHALSFLMCCRTGIGGPISNMDRFAMTRDVASMPRAEVLPKGELLAEARLVSDRFLGKLILE